MYGSVGSLAAFGNVCSGPGLWDMWDAGDDVQLGALVPGGEPGNWPMINSGRHLVKKVSWFIMVYEVFINLLSAKAYVLFRGGFGKAQCFNQALACHHLPGVKIVPERWVVVKPGTFAATHGIRQ
jgi:hypothetical protein